MEISTEAFFNAMKKLQPSQKWFCVPQIVLNLFGGVWTRQNEPKTYLWHVRTIKIETSRFLSKLKKSTKFWLPAMRHMTFSWPPAFAQQSTSQNGPRITSTGRMTLLKVCRAFFRVQRIDWNTPRGFLKTLRRLFLRCLKNQSPTLKYVEIFV